MLPRSYRNQALRIWNETLTKFVKPTFKLGLSVIKLVYCSIKLVYQDKVSLSSIKSTFNAKTLHHQSINLVYHNKSTSSRVYPKFI